MPSKFEHPARRTTAQRLSRAVPFRVDEQKEDLLRMRDEQPDRFAALSPTVHIAVGLYESDRASHEAIAGGAA